MNSPSSDQSKESRKKRGDKFERLAAKFYKNNKYEILEQNWRAGRKEIDLIVRKDNLLIFVEVKSASSKKFGHPAERVDNRKQKNIIEVAKQYLISHEVLDCDFRFDVVAFIDGQLEHYPGAFEVDTEF